MVYFVWNSTVHFEGELMAGLAVLFRKLSVSVRPRFGVFVSSVFVPLSNDPAHWYRADILLSVPLSRNLYPHGRPSSPLIARFSVSCFHRRRRRRRQRGHRASLAFPSCCNTNGWWLHRVWNYRNISWSPDVEFYPRSRDFRRRTSPVSRRFSTFDVILSIPGASYRDVLTDRTSSCRQIGTEPVKSTLSTPFLIELETIIHF